MGAFGISTGLYLGASIIKDIYETSKEFAVFRLGT
jgi:hypothetical protein